MLYIQPIYSSIPCTSVKSKRQRIQYMEVLSFSTKPSGIETLICLLYWDRWSPNRLSVSWCVSAGRDSSTASWLINTSNRGCVYLRQMAGRSVTTCNSYEKNGNGMIQREENWSTGRKTVLSVVGRWMVEYGAMVERYWQGETEVLGEKYYTAWVVDGWMSVEQWWNGSDRGNLKYWEKKIIQRGW